MGLSASIALVAAIDGASEVSGVFVGTESQVLTERAERAKFFIRNRNPIFDGASEARVLSLEQKAKL